MVFPKQRQECITLLNNPSKTVTSRACQMQIGSSWNQTPSFYPGIRILTCPGQDSSSTTSSAFWSHRHELSLHVKASWRWCIGRILEISLVGIWVFQHTFFKSHLSVWARSFPKPTGTVLTVSTSAHSKVWVQWNASNSDNLPPTAT